MNRCFRRNDAAHSKDCCHRFINPHCVVLHELVTNLLYRPDGLGLNRKGRTRSALVIGLGDDDASVYRAFVGQSTRYLMKFSSQAYLLAKRPFWFTVRPRSMTAILLVLECLICLQPNGRFDLPQTKPSSDQEIHCLGVRPPLRCFTQTISNPRPSPTEPILIPDSKSSRDAFSRRSSSFFSSRGFSREPSQPNIYAPPPSTGTFLSGPDNPQTDKRKKTTPGRRGEKRKKAADEGDAEADSRRKRMGRVLIPSLSLPDLTHSRTLGSSIPSDGPLEEDNPFEVTPSISGRSTPFEQAAGKELSAMEIKNKSVSFPQDGCISVTLVDSAHNLPRPSRRECG